MDKDYDRWNRQKQTLERFVRSELVFHEREVWWCSLGLNLGDEQDGKNDVFERPVLVLKKFNDRIACVLPMTTKKKHNGYYCLVQNAGLRKESFVILSQVRLVSVKRFRRYMCKISPLQFEFVQKRFVNLFTKKSEPLGRAPRLA